MEKGNESELVRGMEERLEREVVKGMKEGWERGERGSER